MWLERDQSERQQTPSWRRPCKALSTSAKCSKSRTFYTIICYSPFVSDRYDPHDKMCLFREHYVQRCSWYVTAVVYFLAELPSSQQFDEVQSNADGLLLNRLTCFG